MGFKLFSKMKEVKEKAIVEAFLAGEEANKKFKKAEKIRRMDNKTKEDEDRERQLVKEGERARERQRAFDFMHQRSGLGEKILQGYFTYKMASLACSTLIALNNGGGQRRGGVLYDLATGREEGEAMKEVSSVQEKQAARARQIEDSIESFQHMSDEAERLGITEKGNPLLTAEDKQKMHELAELSYDPSMKPEDYAQRCADLGLDYNDALEAAKADRDAPDYDRERDMNNGRDRGRDDDKNKGRGDEAGDRDRGMDFM